MDTGSWQGMPAVPHPDWLPANVAPIRKKRSVFRGISLIWFTEVDIHGAHRNLPTAVVRHVHRFPGIRFASSAYAR